ncbi:1,6-anhydro-N-acetylmuramyl-L-alanine amidase AmpD [Burkholderiales bacterium 8X]|nr:1,6-anhydro-N-acetylmuramyl-L-alanine amidase AmpD [Burkholderiales bacterium 8X]
MTPGRERQEAERQQHPGREDTTGSSWSEGWYLPAIASPSPNHGPRPAQGPIDLIVLHSISLPPGCYGGDEVRQLFTNTLDFDAHPYYDGIRGIQVSAHFFVRRDGALWQFVSCDRRAWHAGNSAWRGRTNCNDDSIGIELEGLEGELFEPEQYRTLRKLCLAIRDRYPIAHLAGHEDIAPGRKADPGAGFDWHGFERMLGWPSTMFPARIRVAKNIRSAP